MAAPPLFDSIGREKGYAGGLAALRRGGLFCISGALGGLPGESLADFPMMGVSAGRRWSRGFWFWFREGLGLVSGMGVGPVMCDGSSRQEGQFCCPFNLRV
jgi:hypothetical protein